MTMKPTLRHPFSRCNSHTSTVPSRKELPLRLWAITLLFVPMLLLASQAQTLTILHSFNDTDGAFPHARLVRDSGGNFYGTTVSGGLFSCDEDLGGGTVFRLKISGGI